MIDFINEYKSSDLYLFHQDFDSQEDIPRGSALEYAKRERNIPDWTKNILYFPNPAALQPKHMMGLVYDFFIHAHWKPKHIANVLRDIYQKSCRRKGQLLGKNLQRGFTLENGRTQSVITRASFSFLSRGSSNYSNFSISLSSRFRVQRSRVVAC